MDTQRTGQPSDKLSVIVVDENLCHANIARSMLTKLEFRVMAYISPIEALNFLKNNDQDVDFCLVAVDMKEMHGFQFVEVSRELHKDLQVIMMSNDTTWAIMKRCVELGARFLVKKPLDTYTVNNLWQHLEQKFARIKKIKELFQGVEGTTHGLNCLELEKSVNRCGDGTKLKATNLIWTPYLESKFAAALDLLGEGATPSKIQLVMNIKSIKRKHISTHLQKHRKKIEKKLRNTDGKMCNTCASGPNKCSCDSDIQLNDKTHEERTSDQTGSFTKENEGNKVCYEAMQRALRFGVVFDELQIIRNDPSGEEANRGEVDRMADGGNAQVESTFAFGDINAVVSGEARNTDGAKEVMSKVANSGNQVPCGGDQTGVVKLVAYSDSENDEIGP
ncbi:unnamed protein product [Urochloa decumbens]|uniref:Response regulatory domain-containing protein n=1 Tax=Urochloa decumbens TaxID=240449 RepID=A0ABC9AV80_9POAL